MARGTFGERLKRERELREVSLEEVSAATRISARFLEALENEDWPRLPGGVFGRGFVRTIARYLGLSEENLLAEYDLARGETLNAPPVKPEDRIPSPPKWIPVALVLAFLLLLAGLILAGVYGWKKFRAYRLKKNAAVSQNLPVTPPIALPDSTSATASSTSASTPTVSVPLELSLS